MDVNELRSLVTLVSMLCFAGIWAWAWARRNQAGFGEAALIHLTQDDEGALRE
jgi:cytochrome c oxidase cbb3-type subunit IV